MMIQYYTRNTYGMDRHYVADPATARAVQTLTGCKTLEDRHFRALKALGFELIAVQAPATDIHNNIQHQAANRWP